MPSVRLVEELQCPRRAHSAAVDCRPYGTAETPRPGVELNGLDGVLGMKHSTYGARAQAMRTAIERAQ